VHHGRRKVNTSAPLGLLLLRMRGRMGVEESRRYFDSTCHFSGSTFRIVNTTTA
jgi:hypothetical protein